MRRSFLIVGLLAAIVAFGLWLLPDEFGRYPVSSLNLLSRVWLDTITPEEMVAKYADRRFRLLLVPGHDNDYSGAVTDGLREADLTLAVAAELSQWLATDGHFQVALTRDPATGDYFDYLKNYFTIEQTAIRDFRLALRQQFTDLLSSGEIKLAAGVNHNFAVEEVANRLYGLNRWANQNDIDLTLHLHFNDYAGRRRGARDYAGLSVYVPENQYSNARASHGLGTALFQQLNRTIATSSLPIENRGVIEDQELIALGSFGSRDGSAALIEYGYIYEPQFVNPAVRRAMIKELAWQTYVGLKWYFGDAKALSLTTLLPHRQTAPLVEGMKGSADVLALQKALQFEGLYPPVGRTLDRCPLNGNFGPCTVAAVAAFQRRYALESLGAVGPRTLAKLNELYGDRLVLAK